jgi:hypothetical protein
MSNEVPRFFDSDYHHVVTGLNADKCVQVLQAAYRCTQPSRWTKDRQRAVEKESDIAQAIKPASLLKASEQMNEQQPFPNRHH